MNSSFHRPQTESLSDSLAEAQHPTGFLSEQELRGIVDAIPHLIIVLNQDGSPIYANKSVMDYTGLTDDEVRQPGARADRGQPSGRRRERFPVLAEPHANSVSRGRLSNQRSKHSTSTRLRFADADPSAIAERSASMLLLSCVLSMT